MVIPACIKCHVEMFWDIYNYSRIVKMEQCGLANQDFQMLHVDLYGDIRQCDCIE